MDEEYVRKLEASIEKLESEKEEIREELNRHIKHFGEIPDLSNNETAQMFVGDTLGGVLTFNNAAQAFTINQPTTSINIEGHDVFFASYGSGDYELGGSLKEKIKDLINETIDEREENE